MGQNSGYYTKQLKKLQKELQAKQARFQAQQDVNKCLRWREQMLKEAIAATAAGVRSLKPVLTQARVQQPHRCFNSPAQSLDTSKGTLRSQTSNPGSNPVLPNSDSCCQQNTADADASGSSAVDAALESAIFSALDEDSSTDLFFPDPKTAALNHLLSQLATTELKVQSVLLRMGCPDLPGDGLYTSQLLQQLLATEGHEGLRAAAEASPEECLLQLAAAVKQISCLLPRYDDEDDSSCQVSGWSARSQLDCLIDQQVQSAVARSIAGKPCAALQHLAVNMETMRQQTYPDGWFARVAAALQLTAGQKAVFRAAWGKAAADRASLLAKHDALLKQLQPLQQQQAARQQQFEQRLQQVFERCIATMEQRARRSIKALLVPEAAAAAAAAAGVAETNSAGQTNPSAAGCSLNSNRMNNSNAAPGLAQSNIYSSVPAAGCGSSCSGSSSSTAGTASAAAAAFQGACCNASCLMEALVSCRTPEPAAANTNNGVPAAAAAAAAAAATDSTAILSMTCKLRGPEAAAAAAAAAGTDPFSLASQPEVLLCDLRPGQLQLQQKLAAVRASLGVLHAWCGLVCYNTLSRKQLAVAAVTSYPFAFDPVAVCEAVDTKPARPLSAAAAAAARRA